MNWFLLLLLPLTALQTTTNEIRWSSSTPLTWENFSGVADVNSPHDAWTYSGFTYEYNWSEENGKITWTLRAHSFFDPAQSWVKKGKKNPELLAHEQLHFNISELYCRYFKLRVSDYDFTSNFDNEIKAIYDQVYQELLEAQAQYDRESDHYHNKEGQTTWNEFVAEELSRYDYLKASNLFSQP